MNRIIVEIDHPSNLERFTSLLEDLNYVKHFRSDKGKTEAFIPLSDEDWSMPGRPATNEEFELLVAEMENEKEYLDSETARTKTLKEIKQWREQQAR